MATFDAWDYVVFALVLVISAGIGVYFRFTGGKQKTTSEFLLGDRNMSIVPVAISLMTSFMSAVTLLGVSAENYQFGTLFVIVNVSYVLFTPVAAYLYLPVFYNLQTTSVYEYLGMRFGNLARLAASIVYSLQMILYMGIVLFAPALALEAVTGLDKTLSILVMGFVCTFYSTLGGMKAVVFTDVFQSLLMFVAIFSVIIRAGIDAGNLGTIWETAEKGGRIEFLNFDPDPTTRHTWWGLIIGGGITYMSLYGVNQTQIQRMQTLKSLKDSQKTIWLNVPILSLLSLSTSFSGLSIYYMYRDCDPILEGRISSRDQLMPLFVIDTMGHIPALAGLFVSGIFSASLSTVSASLNALAAVTLQDYIKPLYLNVTKRPLEESVTTLTTKVTAFVYGLICIGLAFVAEYLGGVLQAALTIFGVVGGPLLGLFTLGMVFPRANQKGSVGGLLVGLAMSFWVGFGGPKPPFKYLDFSTAGCPVLQTTSIEDYLVGLFTTKDQDDSGYFWLYRLSYMWYPVIGFLTTTIVGLLLSFFFEKMKWDNNNSIYTDEENLVINYKLFMPPIAKLLENRSSKKMGKRDSKLESDTKEL